MTNRTQEISISTAFGLPEVPVEFTVRSHVQDGNHSVPKLDKNYVFRRGVLRDLLNFLENPRGDGFYVWGHYGSGKTTLPYQVAARLNWPISSITATARMRFDDLVGAWTVANGSMQWIDGPLTTAMKEGRLFVLNEGDRADPGELAGLHDILEGHPLEIAVNGGQVIYPHEDFRVVMNGNSNGAGDSTGLYAGVGALDVAFMDRFRVIEVEYPTPDIEESILEKKCPTLPAEIRSKMIVVANQVRKLFIGGAETATPLTITMSTRALCRWAELTLDFRTAPNALSYALNQALLSKAEPEQKIAIQRIAKDVFGTSWSEVDC